MNRKSTRRPVNKPLLARAIQRVDGARRSRRHRREPDLFAIRAPDQSLNARKERRTRLVRPFRIYDHDAPVVSPGYVVRDGHEISARREPHMADPGLGFIDYVADG